METVSSWSAFDFNCEQDFIGRVNEPASSTFAYTYEEEDNAYYHPQRIEDGLASDSRYLDNGFNSWQQAPLNSWNNQSIWIPNLQLNSSDTVVEEQMLDETSCSSPRSASSTPRDTLSEPSTFRQSVKLESCPPVDWNEYSDEGDSSPRKSSSFVCPLPNCRRTYRRKGDLKVHVKKKHPSYVELPDQISKPRSSRLNKPFPCPVEDCPCGFMRQRGLQRHFRKKHPQLVDSFALNSRSYSPSSVVSRSSNSSEERYGEEETTDDNYTY